MYAETQRRVADLVTDFAADKTNIYDLECSTCTSFLDIDRGLNENGCLILVEKVLGESSTLNRPCIKYDYDFKRQNGYSGLEIS